jgi:hypothetical protein
MLWLSNGINHMADTFSEDYQCRQSSSDLPYVLILGTLRFSLIPGVCFTDILKRQLKQGAKQIYSNIKYRLSKNDRVV